jgi:serine/threonine protein phosphatase PrpC
MITCPQCGELAQDGAKFCDRCGQGLDAAPAAAVPAPTRPQPLAVGIQLKGGFEIVAQLDSISIENRYRARRSTGGKDEFFVLRERFGPAPAAEEPEVAPAEEPAPVASPAAEDPNGPHAKTAELRPPAPAQGDDSASIAAEDTADASVEALEAAASATELAGADGSGASGAATFELTEAVADAAPAASAGAPSSNGAAAEVEQSAPDDLGEVFGRVLSLSMTLNHPAFQRAIEGFAEGGRVYLVYREEALSPLKPAGRNLSEPEAISAMIQVCQAISFVHRRGLRHNDICPESVKIDGSGRIRVVGLDYVSNDNEQQPDPCFNEGYTAPEIYRARRVDKRADVFSAGALLYTWLTGERLETESWREEAGPIRFYPPHVVSPELEQAILRAILFDPKDRWPTIDDFKTELTRQLGRVRLRAAGLTDVGMVRDHNEDAVMIVDYCRDSLVDPAQNGLYVVCDGMGGAEAGEVAAAIAVSTIRDYVEHRLGGAEAGDPDKLMIAALEEANSRIIAYQSEHPESRGMGSTGVGALIAPPDAAVGWCGDSRAYLLEAGRLRQVTRDHSLVQRLVEIGQITPDEARHHEHKNVITRSLGARQSGPAGAEAVRLRLKRGDRLLLCSDGLTAHVEDGSIAEILRRHADPYPAARELIAAANAGGGTDNISVIVLFAS